MLGLGLGLWNNVAAQSGGGGSLGPYLPTVTSSPMVVAAPRRMVSGYNGNLFQLSNGTTTQDFAAKTGSDLPDYTAITTFAGGASLTVTKFYDQSGNGRDMTVPTGTVGFYPSLRFGGCAPVQFNGTGGFRHTAGSNIYDSRNASYFEVCQPESIAEAANAGIFSFYNTTAVKQNLAMYSWAFQGTTNDTDGSVAFGSNHLPMRWNVQAIGFTANSSNQTLYCLETTAATGVAATAATSNQFDWGHYISGGDKFGQRSSYVMVLYPALSNTDANTVLASLRTIFSCPTSFTSRVVIFGDSRVSGKAVTANNQNLPTQLALNGTPEIFNVGQSGALLSDLYTSRASYVDYLYTSAYGANKCILIVEPGVNDIIAGHTATTINTDYANLVSAEKTIGFNVMGVTMLPVINGYAGWSATQDAVRTSVNSSRVANSAGCSQVIDVASDPTMGNTATTSNPTYYPDGVHESTAGYALIAPYFNTAINTYV